MNPLYPLNKKLDISRENILQLQNIVDQCQGIINTTRIEPCPSCGQHDHVELAPWSHPNPEHDDHAVIIQCNRCDIQTKPQYWFINTPETAISALHAVYDRWNTRPAKVTPAMEAQA
jgi:hypothetical protein